jgi:hypothetical protein
MAASLVGVADHAPETEAPSKFALETYLYGAPLRSLKLPSH